MFTSLMLETLCAQLADPSEAVGKWEIWMIEYTAVRMWRLEVRGEQPE